MDDVTKLLGEHRHDLERWFDGEMHKLKIVREERLRFHDDLAKRVLGVIGSDCSISEVECRPATPDRLSLTAWNMSAGVAPADGGNMNLPGAVPAHEPPKSADSQNSLVALQHQEATVVVAPVRPSSRDCRNVSKQSRSSGHDSTTSQQDSMVSPVQGLYGLDREGRSLSKQPKGRRGVLRQMTQELSTGNSMQRAVRFHCSREAAGNFTNSGFFRGVCGVVILGNSFFLGISADNILASAMLGKADMNMTFERIEFVFCAFFLIELLLRLAAEGWTFFKSRSDGWWNIFDTVLVGLSLMDVALTLLQAGQVMNITFARVMRLFRLVRILRIVRVMRFFYSFRLMIYSVVYSILCLLWVFGMLLFIMYLFAMFFLHGIAEHFMTYSENSGGVICETALCLELHRLCGDVSTMVLSLFMSICGGIDWRELWVILSDVHWLYGWVFIFYIFFMVFGVLNVVVATFVEQSSLISRRDRELVTQNELEKNRQYYNNIRRFFQEADVDCSGSLSWKEFEDYLGDENVQAYFQSFELDVTQARTLFRLLDLDDSDDVDIDEFVEGCMRMRGQARSIDVHMLLYENEKMIHRTVEFMHHVEDELHEIRTDVKNTQN